MHKALEIGMRSGAELMVSEVLAVLVALIMEPAAGIAGVLQAGAAAVAGVAAAAAHGTMKMQLCIQKKVSVKI